MDELLRTWFAEQGTDVIVQKNETGFSILGNEMMVDPGFASGKAIVEILIEEQTNVIFIGALRLPRSLRNQGKGKEVTNIIKDYALQHGHILLLDACDECDLFWAKQEFVMIHKDVFGLKIMGFPGDRTDLLPVWEAFSKTSVCKEELLFHTNG